MLGVPKSMRIAVLLLLLLDLYSSAIEMVFLGANRFCVVCEDSIAEICYGCEIAKNSRRRSLTAEPVSLRSATIAP